MKKLLIYSIILMFCITSCNKDDEYEWPNENTLFKILSEKSYEKDDVEVNFTYNYDKETAKKNYDYFRLDTIISANNSTLENTFAIARFVTSNIPHSNQTNTVERRNAISLWEFHLNVENAFNCRWHSILTHELLLAAGIKNRYITCFPESSEDPDCHVVNSVWIDELNKWILIDTDMNSYITDENNVPMSIQEIKKYILAKKNFNINPIINKKIDKEYYHWYLTKNLYWFSSFEKVGFDKEPIMTQQEERYIYLIPKGFEPFDLSKSCIDVITTDEDKFWAPIK